MVNISLNMMLRIARFFLELLLSGASRRVAVNAAAAHFSVPVAAARSSLRYIRRH